MLKCVIMVVIGFASGAIMYSYWIPKLFFGIDIREGSEDGNPGSYNTITVVGAPTGMLCMALDVLKAFVPVYVSAAHLHISGYYLVPVVLSPVLGHAFTPFLKFQGGKAVSVTFGSMLGIVFISKAVFLLALSALFFTLVVTIHPNSSKMMVTYVTSCLMLLIWEPLSEVKIAMLLVSLTAAYKHYVRPNKGTFNMVIGPYTVYYEEKRIRMIKGRI